MPRYVFNGEKNAEISTAKQRPRKRDRGRKYGEAQRERYGRRETHVVTPRLRHGNLSTRRSVRDFGDGGCGC